MEYERSFAEREGTFEELLEKRMGHGNGVGDGAPPRQERSDGGGKGTARTVEGSAGDSG